MASQDIKINVNRIHVNPRNLGHLSVSGTNYFRIWEYLSTDHSVREFDACLPLKQEKLHDFVDHCWVLTVYRARFMTGGGYRLLASANFGELVLGCIEAKILYFGRYVQFSLKC